MNQRLVSVAVGTVLGLCVPMLLIEAGLTVKWALTVSCLILLALCYMVPNSGGKNE